jgi:dolichol kinase
MAQSAQITYMSELARKSIHLASLLIPIIYLQIDRFSAVVILAAMSGVAVLVDVLLQRHHGTRAILMPLLGSMLRPHELSNKHLHLNGASWVLISALLTVVLFPKIVAVTAFTILIVSDTFAALIGRKFGRRPFLDKSMAGTVAFIVTGTICVAAYAAVYQLPWTYAVAGLIGTVAGAVTEAASVRLKLDDNLSIPMSVSISMWAVGAILTATSCPDFASSPL